MFTNEETKKKYVLSGGTIKHVPGIGAVDLKDATVKEADYYYKLKTPGLKLVNEPAAETAAEPPKTSTKKT